MSLPAPEPTIDPVAGMSACWGEAEIACVRNGMLTRHAIFRSIREWPRYSATILNSECMP